MSIHNPGTNDGWHGVISAGGQFAPETDRYHMYIGLFCPFAHRANLVRHLCKLESHIPLSIVKPYPKGDDKGWPGWQFPESSDEYPGSTPDQLFHSKYLHEVYFRADSEYKGRYSVPLIWDRKSNSAVNNESAEILRWLPTAFPDHAHNLYPEKHRPVIDAMTPWIQDDLNFGVYKAGFARDQATYDEKVPRVFAALNKLEAIVAQHGGPYILGKDLTELDIRVFATLVRFDAIYVQHFKCNLGTIRDSYPVLNNWLKGMYWNHDWIRETVDFTHIKESYTKSHPTINPFGIVPMGPLPPVETGYISDWTSLKPGHVDHPAVTSITL